MANGAFNFEAGITKKSIKFMFYIAFIPVEITLYVQVDVGIDVWINQEMSLKAGYQRIYHQYGVQYTSHQGWKHINQGNFEFVWNKLFGGNFLSNMANSVDLSWPDSCIDNGIIDRNEPSLKVGISVLYKLYLDITISFLGKSKTWSPLLFEITIISEKNICLLNFNIPFISRYCGVDPKCKWLGTAPDCIVHTEKEHCHGSIERRDRCGNGHCFTPGYKICCCEEGVSQEKKRQCQI